MSAPTPDPDAVEREALRDDINAALTKDHYASFVRGTNAWRLALADDLIAAGWSRSPRPAAVSEGAAGRAMRRIKDRLDRHHHDVEPWDKGYRVGLRDGLEDLAREGVSLAALPHLVGGLQEEAIRADERVKVADRIEAIPVEDAEGKRRDAEMMRGRAAHIARTTPADDSGTSDPGGMP